MVISINVGVVSPWPFWSGWNGKITKNKLVEINHRTKVSKVNHQTKINKINQQTHSHGSIHYMKWVEKKS
jgi:hypothetical protein